MTQHMLVINIKKLKIFGDMFRLIEPLSGQNHVALIFIYRLMD